MCMIKERSTYIPGETVPVLFECTNPFSTEGICPLFPVDFIFFGYTPMSEKFLEFNRGGPRAWNDVQHYKSVTTSPSANGGATVCSESSGYYPGDHAIGYCPHIACGYDSWNGSQFSQPFGDVGSLDKDLPSFASLDSNGDFVSPPADLDSLKSRALSSILPIVKAELSLPNFIYELKDFKRPLLEAARVFRSSSWYSALGKLGLTPQQWRNMTFSKLLKGSAGHYLSLQFNVLPFINDIAKIRSAISRTERRINDFVSREGKPQNRHFAFSWSEFTDSTDEFVGAKPGPYSPFDGTDVSSTRTVSYEPSKFHVQVQYNYNYTGYQREHALLLGQLDSLGINLNPAIVWNALPWTFVVDWVFGIGPFLDQLKVSNFEPVINIHRALWSVKRTRKIEVLKRTRISRSPSVVLTQRKLPSVTQTAYRRSVFVPTISSILSSGLTIKEASLGAALVISHRRR